MRNLETGDPGDKGTLSYLYKSCEAGGSLTYFKDFCADLYTPNTFNSLYKTSLPKIGKQLNSWQINHRPLLFCTEISKIMHWL